MFEVDVSRIDDQLDDIVEEMLCGAGAVVIRGAFDEGEVAEDEVNIQMSMGSMLMEAARRQDEG